MRVDLVYALVVLTYQSYPVVQNQITNIGDTAENVEGRGHYNSCKLLLTTYLLNFLIYKQILSNLQS